ncbi:hypothetical protein DFH06DRAFT_1256911 [Mycena polygramma]|nr:hypothetical protein DFH06DRAFT_1256911 [Mycena polygramma]
MTSRRSFSPPTWSARGARLLLALQRYVLQVLWHWFETGAMTASLTCEKRKNAPGNQAFLAPERWIKDGVTLFFRRSHML